MRSASISKIDGAEDNIAAAVKHLDDGDLVVLPTETVYGVAARADLASARAKLAEIKDRPTGKPFTVHIGHKDQVARYVTELGGVARRLIEKAWPGPMTLVLQQPKPADAPAAAVVDEAGIAAMYHEGTIGLRLPDDDATAEILQRVGGPVVMASANRAGQPPPGDYRSAMAALGRSVAFGVDGGPTRYNKASTVVGIEGGKFRVLREGVFDERMIRDMANRNILFVCSGNTCRSPMAKALAKRLVAEKLGCQPQDLPDHSLQVSSAGASAFPGSPASPNAVKVLAERGIDMADHRSQPLTLDLTRKANHIFTMTAAHQAAVLSIDPTAGDRVTCLSPDGDIEDPFGGDVEDYARCAERIETALRKRLQEIEL